MFGVRGFDVVIGNPPYIQLQKHGGELSKRYSQLQYSTFMRTGDIYCLFYEKGWQLLKDEGILSLITPNTWLQSTTFGNVRRFLTNEFKWQKILITDKIFDATVDTHSLIFSKSKQPNITFKIYKRKLKNIFFSHTIDFSMIKSDGNSINILQSDAKAKLFDKIIKKFPSLSDSIDVYNGVKPFEKGKGKPPQDERIMLEKPFVKSGPKPSSDWLPLLRGSLMNRYIITWDYDYWILYGEWLAAKRNPKIFEAPKKIIVRQTGDSIIATTINNGIICRDNLHILIPKDNIDINFVLGVLNSKFIDFIYTCLNPEKGEALAQVKKNHIEKLPMAFGNSFFQKKISDLVIQILKEKKDNIDANTSKLEKEIDLLIYSLYDLDLFEAQIIDQYLTSESLNIT